MNDLYLYYAIVFGGIILTASIFLIMAYTYKPKKED